jgi:SAM-dependent methyltransferase
MEHMHVMTTYIDGSIERKLEQLKVSYYTHYYKEQLGLPDYKERVNSRLSQHLMAAHYINKIENLINYNFTGKKTLVVGAGTGAEYFELWRRNADVFGIEPNEQALEIIHLESEIKRLPAERCSRAFAEKLPYDDGRFDFVCCFAVLEHVNDVEQSLHEMKRVTKTDGYMFIFTADYRQFWEPHYKMYLPMFLPKKLLKFYLFLKRKPVAYFDTLQFVTSKQIRKFARHNKFMAMEINQPYLADYLRPHGFARLVKWFQDELEISRDQFWILKKVE